MSMQTSSSVQAKQFQTTTGLLKSKIQSQKKSPKIIVNRRVEKVQAEMVR